MAVLSQIFCVAIRARLKGAPLPRGSLPVRLLLPLLRNPLCLRFHLVPSTPISHPTLLLFHRLPTSPREANSAVRPGRPPASRIVVPFMVLLFPLVHNFAQISPFLWCSLGFSPSPLLLFVLPLPCFCPQWFPGPSPLPLLVLLVSIPPVRMLQSVRPPHLLLHPPQIWVSETLIACFLQFVFPDPPVTLYDPCSLVGDPSSPVRPSSPVPFVRSPSPASSPFSSDSVTTDLELLDCNSVLSGGHHFPPLPNGFSPVMELSWDSQQLQ